MKAFLFSHAEQPPWADRQTALLPSGQAADQVLIEIHRAGKTAVFDVLVDAVHALHLLRAVDHGRKPDHVVTDGLVEAGVGGAGMPGGRGRERRAAPKRSKAS